MTRVQSAREMVTHALVDALIEHGPTLDEAFRARHAARLSDEQRAFLGKPSVVALSLALEARAAADRFGEASALHDAELRDDDGPLRLLDSSTQHLFEILSRLRQSVVSVFGESALRAVRLDARLTTHPILLLGQVQKTREAIANGALRETPRIDRSISMDLDRWNESLEEAARGLESAMADVSREVSEARVSLENKLEAARVADVLIINARELVAALFQSAGLSELGREICPLS
jgi:hypothetical protein